MTEKLLTVFVGEEFEIDENSNTDNMDINDLENFLVEAKKKGATHLSWWILSGECAIQPIKTVVETEEQYKERQAETLRIRETYLSLQKTRDRIEYERLKLIFGKD